MNTNALTPADNLLPPAGPLPGVEYLPGDLVMELDEEGLAALADHNWISEEYSKGTFDEFRGEYIAVVNKKVLGHNKRWKTLVETVSAETGISPDRIVTTLIFRKPLK